jgi:aryl-alcohol dehydrogenase-like predicted oxidoreductase
LKQRAVGRRCASTTKPHRLAENIEAASLALTAEEVGGIDAAAARIAVQGDRYPPAGAARTRG